MEYIPFSILKGLMRVKDIMNVPGLPKGTIEGTKVWCAMASAINYCSAAHKDPDFFLSLLNVSVNNGIKPKIDDEIMTHFVFPYIGWAVGLRDGDLLIFNPQFDHCASQQNEKTTGDVILTSFYLKSLIIGGNNNTIPLSTEHEKLLKELLELKK